MISPNLGADLAQPVATIYRDAELRILAQIAASLASGIDNPKRDEWERLQLSRIQSVRKQAAAELARVSPDAYVELMRSLNGAYSQGSASAMADVSKHLDPLAATTIQKRAAVRALAADTAERLTAAHSSILRRVDDVYRSVVRDVTASVLAGAEGRRQATQRAIDSFLSKGLNGIQTKRGTMDISTYAEMAVRTSTARAAIDGHTDAMSNMGLDLVTVEPGPRSCPICDLWARKILSTNGTKGKITVPNLAADGDIEIDIDDTLANARAAGWGHPNCRCNLAAFLPGVTSVKEIQRPPFDAEGYKAQQQQRAIERQIRGWKTKQAIAITPDAKAEAAAKIKGWQAAMRDHMEAHPDLKRQSRREGIGQLGAGFKPAKAASSTPLLDKMPRLTKPRSAAEATKGLLSNPGNELERPYQINCSYVVNAVELQARGFDVIAKPISIDGRDTTVMAADWVQADGKPAAFTYANGGKRGIEEIISEWGPGARGQVVISWKGGGAHVFNAELDDGGAIHYFEGQVAESNAAEYFARRKPGSLMAAMRTDNLVPTDRLTTGVMSRDSAEAKAVIAKAEAKTEAKAAKAAADKLAAEAFAKREAERAARLATPRGELDDVLKRIDTLTSALDNLLEVRPFDDPVVIRYMGRLDEAKARANELRLQIDLLER